MQTTRFALTALLLTASSVAQVAWQPLLTPNTPGERHNHAMAYDAARGETVMFGGLTGALVYGDTWTLGGTTVSMQWTQRGVTSPAPRAGHTMVYDPLRQVVVMFGGNIVGGGASNETWEWDGSNWTLRTPATAPPPRWGAASAAWPSLGGIVVHGGYPTDGSPHFWLWNGTSWQNLTTSTTPNDGAHAMAYHESMQRLLVLGPHSNHMWDGTSWTRNHIEPGSPTSGCLTYDSINERVVACGGYDSSLAYYNQTWSWHGVWTRVDSATQGPWRSNFGMAFDQAQGKAVFYGGHYSDWSSSSEYGDTQVLQPISVPGYFDPSVTGFGFSTDCQHIGDGLFSYTDKPLIMTGGERAWINESFAIYGTRFAGTFAQAPTLMMFGSSSQFWNGVPLPIDLGVLGRPDCLIHVEVLGTVAQTVGYNAVWPMQIPNLPILVGSTTYFQTIGLSQLGGIFTSNALEVVVGER